MNVSRSLETHAIGKPNQSVWSKESKLAIFSIAVVYLFALGHRPLLYRPGSFADDALFVRLAIYLASGQWLGPYDHVTLVKGMGFPLFLSLNYFVGLPENLAVAAFYAVSCLYFGSMIRVALQTERLALAMFGLLVFLPPLASAVTARVDRNLFCTALTTAAVASLLNLVLARRWPRSRLGAALLTGFLVAWFWIAREESLWLAPALVLIVALALLTEVRRRDIFFRAALAIGVAALALTTVGLVNRAVYGRFVLDEMTSAPLQSALIALERASYPYWALYAPVPRIARAKIYEQSPTFARLKPFLDSAQGSSGWEDAGCKRVPGDCNEIKAGWFVWALRDAAAKAGAMTNAAASARFFESIADEVSQACADKRLNCAGWIPPLLPPFTRDQVRKFPGNLRKAIQHGLLWKIPSSEWPSIGSFSGVERQTVELTGVAEHGPGRIIVLHGHGSWTAGAPLLVGTTSSTQLLDRELTQRNSDVTAQPARTEFTITLACLFEPCPVKVGPDADSPIEMPAQSLARQSITFGDRGSITFDSVELSPLTLRSRAGQIANAWLPCIHVFYRYLSLSGLLCFVLNFGVAVVRRELPRGMMLAGAFYTAVAARILILALVDATAFPAANYTYMGPCLPLSLAAAILSIFVTVEWLRDMFRQWRGEAFPSGRIPG